MVQLHVFNLRLPQEFGYCRKIKKKGREKTRGEESRKAEKEKRQVVHATQYKNYLIGFVLSAVFKLSIVLLLSSSSSFSKASRDFLYAKKTKVTSSIFVLIIVQVRQAHRLHAITFNTNNQ